MEKHKILRTLCILAVALTASILCGAGWPKYNEIPNPPGANHVWDGTYWRPSSGTASGVQAVTVIDTSGNAAAISYASSTAGTVVPVSQTTPLPAYFYEHPTGYEVFTVPAVGSVAITIPAGTSYINFLATVPYQMALDTTTLKAGTAPTIGGTVSVGATTTIQLFGYLGATSTVTCYKYGPGK